VVEIRRGSYYPLSGACVRHRANVDLRDEGGRGSPPAVDALLTQPGERSGGLGAA